MLKILPKILVYRQFRNNLKPLMLPMNLTVSLLYKCNSRCKTCNIYNKTAKRLSLSEYEEIFRRIGKAPFWITLSGGEPFLRDDIADICKIIYKHSKPAIINIPTNGILTEKIIKKVTEIAKHCKKSQIIVNLSIDGIEEEHDKLRGIPGNYKKVTATFKELKKLDILNLSVGIHTVISKFNVKEFPRIATKLSVLNPDSFISEIAENRVELDTMNSDISPKPLAYRSAIDFLIHKMKHEKLSGLSKITQAFRIEYYNLVKEIIRDKTQVIPCYAGIASAQISPDGDVWSCCIKAESMGNLRDNDYNFKKIWKSDKFHKERESIKNKECQCPLANAAYTNMLMHYPTLFRVFIRSFIKWWS